jgi:hypothetical protein
MYFASAAILGLSGAAQAANLGDPSTYMGDATTNNFGFNVGGTTLLYTDPSPGPGGAICDPIGGGGSLANCDGDEYFSIDFGSNDALPLPITGPTFGVTDGSLPLPFGAEVVPNTSFEFVYGTSASGVLSEFVSPSAFNLRGGVGADIITGAFTDPVMVDIAELPMTLFLDLDSPLVPVPNTLDEPPADLFYLSGVSEALIRDEAGGSSLSLSLFGMYAQAERISSAFGDIDQETLEFLFNGEFVATFQFAGISADDLRQTLVNTGVTGVPLESVTTSFSGDATPKTTPEPTSIIGLLSLVAGSAFLKKKTDS